MKAKPVPAYRKHKQSGQAVVTVRLADGRRKDVLLGRYDSPESKAEYRRVLTELEAGTLGACRPGSDATVNELLVPFLRFAREQYPDKTYRTYLDSLGPLRRLYGHSPAREFGPLCLKSLRRQMVDAELARSTVTKRVNHVRRFFRWAVSEELLPTAVLVALQAVEGLRAGRSGARELEPVRPPEPGAVGKTLPHLSPTLRALAELQLLTAARPCELVRLTAADIDRAGSVWVVRPADHKTAHRGKARAVYIGPRGQAILAPLLVRAGGGYLFSPSRSEADRNRERAAARKTPKWPSHMRRNERKRTGWQPRDCYTVDLYRENVAWACERAGVPVWRPNQLRHAAATALRRGTSPGHRPIGSSGSSPKSSSTAA